MDPTFGGSVTVAVFDNPGGATLGGTLMVTAEDGVATFSGLTLNSAGTGYTIQMSATGLTAATTNPFNVVVPQFVVTTQPPASVIVGAGFGFTVAAEDSSGDVDTSFSGIVTVALGNNPSGTTLGGTLMATAQDGVATFSGLTLDEPGTGYTLSLSSTGLTGATTNPFNVAIAQLVVSVQPPANVLAGSDFGLTVTAEDSSGNVDSSFNGLVTVALLNNPGGATLGGTLMVTAQSGVATFSGRTLNQPGAGYTLELSSPGLIAATTNPLNVDVPTAYTVDLTSANGTGSGNSGDLVYVVNQANANPNPAGSVIEFDPTVFGSPRTITVRSTLELTEADGPEVIDGPGANLVTVSGKNKMGVFGVSNGVTATLAGLTIADGNATDGGGINNVGTTTVTESTIDNNSASNNGAGIFNAGTMTVTDSTIDNNSASSNGGGIFNAGAMIVTDSAIDNNVVGTWGGGIFSAGAMTIVNSTIADNNSDDGGGILSQYGGTMAIVSSTIANNNSSGNAGGIWNNGGTLTVANSTIARNNVASSSGGAGLEDDGAKTTLNNTIVALNTEGTGSGAPASDIAGTVAAASAFNLIGTGGSGGLSNGVNGNQVDVANPGLGTLADNGGPTQTIALLTTSPAIDAGSNALAVDPSTGLPLATDQRGAGFPRIVNGTVDIGAYEFQGAVIAGVSVGWGTQTADLQIAPDGLRLLPAGRHTDLPWLGIDELTITLSEAETLASGDVTVTSAIGVNYGPVTISGSGTSYTITLAQPINEADRVTFAIGNATIATFTRRLDVLPGDFNDDGVVNSQDLVDVRNEWLGINGAVPTIFGDMNGDGVVNIDDYNIVRAASGTVLPPAPSSNLLVNGDFSLGNTGFTSQYVYSTNLEPEGNYVVGDNPHNFHPGGASFGDHTTGTGLMLIANGAPTPNTVVWQETVNVSNGTNYVFSGWAASWGEGGSPAPSDPSPAQLEFFVNGVQIGSEFTLIAQDGQWSQFSATWNSGTSGSATITIVDMNTASDGNDFAVDDLVFGASEAATAAISSDGATGTAAPPPATTGTTASPAADARTAAAVVPPAATSAALSVGVTTAPLTVTISKPASKGSAAHRAAEANALHRAEIRLAARGRRLSMERELRRESGHSTGKDMKKL